MVLEILPNLVGRNAGLIALKHPAIRIDQELGEVPGNVAAFGARLPRLEITVQVAGTRPVDLDLLEHRKVRVVAGRGELEDFRVRARLLPAELVARKAEHRHLTF